MQVKNSIDHYRKAVKNINANANNAQRQPAQPVVQNDGIAAQPK